MGVNRDISFESFGNSDVSFCGRDPEALTGLVSRSLPMVDDVAVAGVGETNVVGFVVENVTAGSTRNSRQMQRVNVIVGVERCTNMRKLPPFGHIFV